MRRIAALVVVLVGALRPSPAEAQGCMRPGPADRCLIYPITDVTVSAALADTYLDRHLDLATQLGFLVNASPHLALGPAFLVGAYLDGGWHSQLGVNARLRINLPPLPPGPFPAGLHLDLTPGLILADSPPPDGIAGYSGELAVGFRDWVSLSTRVDVTRRIFEEQQVAWLLGLRAGSYPGLALSALGLIGGGLGYLWSRMA